MDEKNQSEGIRRMLKSRWLVSAMLALSAAILICGYLWFRNAIKVRAEIRWDRETAQQYLLPVTSFEPETPVDPSEPSELPAKRGNETDLGPIVRSMETDAMSHLQLWMLDIRALRQTNPDAAGWIYFPETEINYPVVQGNDNLYYLNHRFDGSESTEGSIFIDSRCELFEAPLIIYGHNTESGKFNALNQYLSDPAYYAVHPYFIFYSEEYPTGMIYEIFSAFRADIHDGMSANQVYQFPAENLPEYITYLSGHSVLDTGITATPDQRIILLSTCCYSADHRCVVCGVERESVASALAVSERGEW